MNHDELLLDPRTLEDLCRRVEELAASYTPEWRFSRQDPDIGSTLALLFAGQMADNLRRLNRLPEKYHTEFGSCGRGDPGRRNYARHGSAPWNPAPGRRDRRRAGDVRDGGGCISDQRPTDGYCIRFRNGREHPSAAGRTETGPAGPGFHGRTAGGSGGKYQFDGR